LDPRTRCFKHIASGLACMALIAGTAKANEDEAFLRFLADKHAELEGQLPAPAQSFVPSSARDEGDARAIADSAQQASLRATGAGAMPGKYAQFRTVVFISMGMPERTLRALFRQAGRSPEIGFVLRGMNSPDMYREMKRVRDLMSKEGESIVFIDPLLFQNYHVDRVPFTLHKAADGRWYGLWGEVAIEGARELIERGKGGRNRPPVGPVYAIKEPDMQQVMRKKFESADWKKTLDAAKDRAQRTEIDVALPAAEKDRVRLVDVSSPVPRDVLGPNGEVLARAGTMINPLEFISLDAQYVVFDPTSRFEAAVVGRWRQQYPSATLIATHWDTRLGSKYDSPVYVLDPLIKRRFQIEHTPSLIVQEGVRLKVTEVRARP